MWNAPAKVCELIKHSLSADFTSEVVNVSNFKIRANDLI